MQDGNQDSFGFHESFSTTENFYCRPLEKSQIVDALTCPTPFFNSDKGRFDPAGNRILYPPRHDVAASQCRVASQCGGQQGCNDSPDCLMLADLDDVAAISAATPNPYTQSPYVGMWMVPGTLPDGSYWVFLEVNKQYDQDAGQCPSGNDRDCPPFAPTCDPSTHFCARHPSHYDQSLLAYGIGANFGQPSLVWAMPIQIDQAASHTSTTNGYVGYTDWDLPQGNLFAPDGTIADRPGTGAGRLAHVTDTDGTWQFKVISRPCGDCTMAPAPPPIADLDVKAIHGDDIRVSFTQVGFGATPVAGYQIRYTNAAQMSDDDFVTANPGPMVPPAAPGTKVSFDLTQHDGIQAQRQYTVGVRSLGDCMKASPLSTKTVTTPRQEFVTLSGCFIATAAFGSELEPEVVTLRRVRDRVLLRHALGKALVALYYGISPPLARAIAGEAALRASVRVLLRPEIALAQTLDRLLGGG
jgi:hypothetical protein